MDASDLPSVPRSAAVALAGSALLLVAAFLPWSVEPGTASYTGFDHGDGYVTFGVAVVVVAVVLGRRWSAGARAATALASLVPGYLFAKWFLAIRAEEVSDPAIGLYLTLLAGGILLGSAVYSVVDDTTRRDESDGATVGDPVDGERDGSA